MHYTLHGARVVDALLDVPGADLTVADQQINAVQPSPQSSRQSSPSSPPSAAIQAIPLPADERSDARLIDVSGAILMPGFIDIHTHGGGGLNLQTTDPAEIAAYARWVVSTGVTSFLAGVVGTPGGPPEEQIRAAVAACRASEHDFTGAAALGIHLEGPYISERRRGAHHTSWLRAPESSETEHLLELADGWLRIITVAPELEGAAALIRRMVAAGVTVSIGHTDATYAQTCEAIQLGATHATHCCNAMPPLHHRHPGPLAAMAESPTVDGELIADGIHVHPAMMRLVVKMFGVERTVVITDALAGAGLSEGAFEFNGQHASVAGGVARLDDGTITGSVLTMDQALRNIIAITGVSLSQAVGMLTRNPARSAGVAARKGRLAAGYDADLLLFDPSLTLQATIRGGVLVYAPEAWRERLAGIPVASPPTPPVFGGLPQSTA